MEKNKVIIFDTTLRDGEQSAHATLSPEEKLEIADLLAKAKIDVIEAGFPVSSEGDFEAVKTIAKKVKGPYIAGLSRAVKKDIERAWDAVKYSDKPMIHTFIASSPIHMEKKLGKSPEKVLKMAVDSVAYAKNLVKDKGQVEFSPEDATRSRTDFLFEIIEKAIEAGADVVNIPDTVGYAAIEEFSGLLISIKQNVPNIDQVVMSVHCHDDLGLAVANSIEAVRLGVEQVECTINGIGERAGNAALEEIVMGLNTRKDFYRKSTGINTRYIAELSHTVKKYTGISVQPNKSIVGENAFKHSSGVHADGTLKNRQTYEIMNPKDIGLTADLVDKRIIIGPRTGSKAVIRKAKRLGYKLSKEEAKKTYEIAMQVADAKKEVTDEDLAVIIDDEVRKVPEKYRLIDFHVTAGRSVTSTACVTIKYDGQNITDSATGDGPVSSVYNTIERITGIKTKLENYDLKAIGKGRNALGEVTVIIKDNGNRIIGRGVSTDTIEASANAYMNAVNKLAPYKKQ